ncbi:two-component response regulator [Caenispirillum salinarum AK4]|uniref:Two-component response regulator n=1 Tax=Caenispirillum salinarum AK4 TaxID=1238182 RepID=K9GU06_9PROT|nr:response regulator transcription factor [Caenispirillum salinarum]EKV28627.1 two-component response regulator [Caenispirillum salinarum AK4]
MKILIADDHELFRDGLRLVLSDLGPDLTVIEASSYDQTLEITNQEDDLDLVLLDLVMPGMPWSEGLGAVKRRLPKVPVVILSASEDRRLVLEAVRLGAAGFIPKTSSSKVMLSALRLVMSGGVYLPPALIDENAVTGRDAMAGPDLSLDATPLTPRQREVLALLGQGKSNKEIARILNLSEGTVKLHVTAILKALNVSNRTGAVVAASRLGLTSLEKAEAGNAGQTPEAVGSN